MIPSADSVALLDRLESEERRLLSWGYVDGAFSGDELESLAREALPAASQERIDAAIESLLNIRWLFRIPTDGRFRTRSAEALRLLASLRQIRVFPGDSQSKVAGLWRGATPLVADFRFLAPPRSFPRRDLAVGAVEARLVSTDPTRRSVLRAIVGDRRLSSFQVRAAERVLGMPSDAGTVVCSGTGSGKTLAFYLPAFLAMVPLADAQAWTKCIAIYPRTELLKDQLREAIAMARRVLPAVKDLGRRGLTFGALFADVKEDAGQVASKYGWEEGVFGGVRGRLCPFVSCPDCGQSMYWSADDLGARREILRCSNALCRAVLGSDILRLTRRSLRENPPDVLFVSAEMLNRNLATRSYARLFGVGPETRRPRLMLLDEIHTYEGPSGAHVALLLRRWQHLTRARPHYVGLSATLEDAPRFFGELVSLNQSLVAEVSPFANELDAEGADYQIALRWDPNGGTSPLSTTIQTLMLIARVLEPRGPDELHLAGSRVFAFSDRIDSINRLLANLRDAEGRWPDSNRLRPRGTVLAGLRSTQLPNRDQRYLEGQSWDLVEDIAHVLQLQPTGDSSLTVDRTIAEDRGVNPAAQVVVASAALEVGFDDPTVGAVVQHKAPRSAAAFLQRKGRAGRLRKIRADGSTLSMRPWTVVVLSHFGRDRVAYQDYEQIFSPTLRPRHLPIGNRSLLRVQATYALFDYLGRKAGSELADPWRDLASPADRDASKTERQASYVAVLKRLLADRDEQDEFARHVQWALGLPIDEVKALLWEPPRPVLLGAVPTLLRRLEEDWRRAFEPTSLEPNERYGPPIPEFVQRTLFTPLLVPDVAIRLPVSRTPDPPDDKGMLLADAFRDFAPGNVSKRFDFSGDVSHWVDPGSTSSLSIDTFTDAGTRVAIGRFSYTEDGVSVTVDVYRPQTIRVASPDGSILPTSSGRPRWISRLTPCQPGHSVDLPLTSALGTTASRLVFHTHQLGNPVEVSRFVVGADVETKWRGGAIVERRLDLVDGEERRVGLGWTSEVDAIALHFAFPEDLVAWVQSNAELTASLRTARFRDLVRGDAALNGIVRGLQREGLVDAYIAALLLALAGDAGASVEQVAARLTVRDIDDAVVALVDPGDDDDSEDVGDQQQPVLPRRILELRDTLTSPTVFSRLREHGIVLWQPIDSSWLPWLRDAFRATLGASLRDAIISLCPEVDDDDLVVEGRGVADEDYSPLWVTESAIGGSGALEAFYAKYSSDPRGFVRIWAGCLGPSDPERVASSLERTLELLAGSACSVPLVQRFAAVRSASSHEETAKAVTALRSTLTLVGIQAEHATMASLFARVLRPGSSPGLDAFLLATVQTWKALEVRSGLIVDSSTFSRLHARTPGLEGLVPGAPAASNELRAWRESTLRSLLWRRPAAVRREGLALENRFLPPATLDRLLIPVRVEGSPEVEIRSENWFDDLTDAINRWGVVRLVAPPDARADMAVAIRRLATTPIDTGALHVYARLSGYSRDTTRMTLTVEMPEALQ